MPILIFVQRLAHLLKRYGYDRDVSIDLLFHHLVIEFGSHPKWLMMLTMAFELRAIVVVLDGIDEAAGRRKDIEKLVLDVLVQSGQRLVTTSRPEGVDLKLFQEKFVIIGLKALDEKQAQHAIQQQMQSLESGRDFSLHLLAFQHIRKEHDRVWMEGSFESDGVRACVEALPSPDGFCLAEPSPNAHRDKDGTAYDPTMRQHCAYGGRVIQRCEGAAKSAYWEELDKSLHPLLQRLDGILELPKDATDAVVQEEVSRALAYSASPSSRLKTVAGRLCLVARSEGKLPSSLVHEIRARTDELYQAVETLEPTFKVVMEAVLRAAGLDPNEVVVTAEDGKEVKALSLAQLKDPVWTL